MNITMSLNQSTSFPDLNTHINILGTNGPIVMKLNTNMMPFFLDVDIYVHL
jgi:hypothetical protein